MPSVASTSVRTTLSRNVALAQLTATTVATGGVGRFIAKTNRSSAEVAFVVDECYQGLGIATLLLQHLTTIARMLEFREFTADVLQENEQMLRVFRNSGLAMQTRTSDGICKIWLSVTE